MENKLSDQNIFYIIFFSFILALILICGLFYSASIQRQYVDIEPMDYIVVNGDLKILVKSDSSFIIIPGNAFEVDVWTHNNVDNKTE